MPGPIIHLGATVTCSHAGQAQPVTAVPRVTVGGAPVVTLAVPYVIAGCALASVPSPPCASAQWTAGAQRVRVLGQPVAIQGGQSTCLPTGTPLLPTAVQPRVVAT
jgi:uncharacterized Zn-binding protein involved in type VI secretion